MINNLLANDFLKEILQNLIPSLITSTCVGIFTFFFTKKYFKLGKLNKRLKDMGMESIVDSTKNGLNYFEIQDIFKNSKELNLVFISGVNFIKNNKDRIEKYTENGGKIKILVAHPESDFVKDIEQCEEKYFMSKRQGEIREEVLQYEELLNKCGKNIEVRFFKSEYRLPIIIAKYDKRKKYDNMCSKAWITITLPPYKAKDASMMIRGNVDYSTCEKNNIVLCAQIHFDSIWKRYENNNAKKYFELMNAGELVSLDI